ncbi:MAG: mrcA [candidate division NC10 bacterium]|nr:mrcA [candidate division NC10 bacterium]
MVSPGRAQSASAPRRSILRRVILVGFWAVVLTLTIGLGVAAGIFAAYLKDLPSLDGLEEYQPSIATTLYTDQDEPFHSFYEQRRILVPLDQIPAQLRQAVLAVEDARFFEHHGLSARAIARAFIMNVLARRKAQGGSTITQQLARGLFLTPEKNISRKIKEALLSVEIEKRYSKERILELYFNLVYFGHGAYGVEAAAQTYFKKSVGELSLAEAAMLAGLPNAPNRFSPIVDPERARRRRDHVLNRMVDEKFIARADADAASRTPFNEALFTRSSVVAPYFVEHVRQILEETYGAYALYNTGLKVYTTLNLRMHRAAEAALVGGLRDLDKARGYRPVNAEGLRRRIGPYTPRPGEILPGTVVGLKAKTVEVRVGRYRGEIQLESLAWTKLAKPSETFREGTPILVQVLRVNDEHKTLELGLEQQPDLEGAFVALDPRDGAVKAMIGGYDFERSKFNRATQAKRQPGSAFKPFIYAAAFDRGLTPSTVIDDSPVSFHTRVGGQLVEWSPRNFDRKFRGPTTLRRALENSINVVTVKLLQQVGVEPVVRLAHQVGIESDLRREIALALGVSEVSPLELVSAYGVFANGGVRAEPFSIRRVTDQQGRTLEQHVTETQEVMRPETAYVLVNVMKGVIQRGTGARARVLDRPLAGKTGTTDDATDLWFVGFSPSLVAGVWIGYDVKRSLGSAETGGRLALPIWIQFMQKALADAEAEDFPVPENVVAVRVDHQTGLPAPPGDPNAIMEYFIRGAEPKAALAASPTPPPIAGETAPAPAEPPAEAVAPAEDVSVPAETSLALPRPPQPAASPASPPRAQPSQASPGPRIPPATLPPGAGNQ